jgi:hypothetical protein
MELKPKSDVARCLVCGSSEQEGGKWAGALKCAKCGAAMGLRYEKCWVNRETITKLVAHRESLEKAGFKFSENESLGKSIHETLGDAANLMVIVQGLTWAVPKLVRFLKAIGIPDNEILRLRLDEPKAIKELYESPSERRASPRRKKKARKRPQH